MRAAGAGEAGEKLGGVDGLSHGALGRAWRRRGATRGRILPHDAVLRGPVAGSSCPAREGKEWPAPLFQGWCGKGRQEGGWWPTTETPLQGSGHGPNPAQSSWSVRITLSDMWILRDVLCRTKAMRWTR